VVRFQKRATIAAAGRWLAPDEHSAPVLGKGKAALELGEPTVGVKEPSHQSGVKSPSQEAARA